MLTLSPARLEALSQLCIQEFRQFECAELVIITLDAQGYLNGTVRLCQALDQLSPEQLLGYLRQANASSAVLASQRPWPLDESDPALKQLDQLLERCQAQAIGVLDYLCIQGLNYCSLRTTTDLWYAICA